MIYTYGGRVNSAHACFLQFLHDFAILAMYALCDECFILASDQTSFNVNTVKVS